MNYENTEDLPIFEECFGMLDLANLRKENFKGYNRERINKTRNALIFLIFYLIDKRNLREINHKKLINRLKSEKGLKETAFISLNYDILIDNAMIDLIPEFYTDYGIEFINHKRPQDSERSVLLLKPHGSLNWLYCPTCNHIELFPKENCTSKLFHEDPVTKEILEEKCDKCGTPKESVIIPMTYYKEMSNPFIRQISLEADEILREADKIFICGYSFSDADIHIKYLLKRAERFMGKTPEIYVINNHPDKTDLLKEEEKKRFKRFFKNKDKIHYTDKSFEDFAMEGIKS